MDFFVGIMREKQHPSNDHRFPAYKYVIFQTPSAFQWPPYICSKKKKIKAQRKLS